MFFFFLFSFFIFLINYYMFIRTFDIRSSCCNESFSILRMLHQHLLFVINSIIFCKFFYFTKYVLFKKIPFYCFVINCVYSLHNSDLSNITYKKLNTRIIILNIFIITVYYYTRKLFFFCIFLPTFWSYLLSLFVYFILSLKILVIFVYYYNF